MKSRQYLFLVLLMVGYSATAQKKVQKESSNNPSAEISALLAKHGCSSCHHSARRMVGPPFADVAKRNYSPEIIIERIATPQPTNWPGYPPMPPLKVPNDDAMKIAEWINSVNGNTAVEAAKPKGKK